ncbi:MAG: DUF1987 domain-containing protein [Flavobacteriales bacterium]|nr:DUF1987 domain-containing protein [Flavobacteriales bacterium]
MSLEIEATVKTPKIVLDSTSGKILLAGISIPEDPYDFYGPVETEIDSYLKNPAVNTNLEFQLEYFNTSSTLIIRNLIRKLSNSSRDTNLKVHWYYEAYDEDMKEAGDEFKKLFEELDFEVVEVDEFPIN